MRNVTFFALLAAAVLAVGSSASAQERFFTPSQIRGESGMAKQRTQIIELRTKVDDSRRDCPVGQVIHFDGSGWGCVPEADPQVGALTADKWCKSNGTTITCNEDDPSASMTETDPTVEGWAKVNLGACSAGQVLTYTGSGGLTCTADAGGSGDALTLGELGDVSLSGPSIGEILTFNGTDWINGAETDPQTETFAKNPLPTCTGSETLWANGTNLSCRADAGGSGDALDLNDLGDVETGALGANKVLSYNGSLWVAAEETDPVAKTFAKTDLPTCTGAQALTADGTSLTCKADSTGVTAEVDPTVHTFAKSAPPTCGANEVITANGSVLSCASTSGVEVDPLTKAFAKANLPTCAANEVLKANGTVLSCVADAGAAAAGGSLWVDNTTYISHNGNAAVVTGSHGSGDAISALDGVAGSRMFFYPRKSAFRSGQVTGTQWDDASIGDHSFASGLDTKASGAVSYAFGREITASGANTFAIALNDQNGADLTQANTMAIMGGKVGIGLLDPSSELEVNGNIETTTVHFSSDQKWKTNIATLDNALANVLKLRGVSYDWRRDEFPTKNFPDGHQIGLIAQEVETVFPELVHTSEDGKTVNYAALVAPLVEAVKAQQARIDSLEAELKTLKKQ